MRPTRRDLHKKAASSMTTTKTTWQRPSFSVTGTGFEVTMYLGTQTGARA